MYHKINLKSTNKGNRWEKETNFLNINAINIKLKGKKFKN
jgi:hypothetical protein